MAQSVDRLPDRPGGDDPGRGRRLGIDVGSVRIGVAVSDPDGILATPVETVLRDRRKNSDRHLRRLDNAGRPNWMWSKWWWACPAPWPTGPVSSAQDAIGLADQLVPRASRRYRCGCPTNDSLPLLRSGHCGDAGIRAKGQRSVIDQAAAVGILQNWLDQRRAVLAAHERGRG